MKTLPMIVEYELTTQCNFRCIHCYCKAGKKDERELNLEEIESLMVEMKELGVRILDLIGGEPLLHPKLLDILYFGKEIDQRLMVNTNGSLATEEMVKKIKNINPDVLIGISLEGPDPETNDFVRGKGNFKKAIDGIKNFIKYGFHVTILNVINSRNWWKIENMIKLARSLGVQAIYLDRFIPVGRGEIYASDLDMDTEGWTKAMNHVLDVVEAYENDLSFYIEESISGKPCPAGITQASILIDGTVVPCGHFRYNEEFYMGNIREKRFKDIWNSYKPSRLSEISGEGCKAYNFLKTHKKTSKLAI